ncbi:hypothetical protein [Variovorax fucosicus]|uniref:hypothetical protein n=1 Tax=Variovorax fucosicus TaxID=3053517 RepID=UPI00257680AE|nr:hypothetical protein [Variovorax sp. J22G47]MDM0055382.1 hypothetical protein [Variovorax sp. J22G47]
MSIELTMFNNVGRAIVRNYSVRGNFRIVRKKGRVVAITSRVATKQQRIDALQRRIQMEKI